MSGGLPWWWLRDHETRALGLGEGAERTSAGVLFGDPRAPIRLEVVARDERAPLRLGPVSVRVWGGDTADPAVVGLLHRVAKALHARREGSAFAPEAVDWAARAKARDEHTGGDAPGATTLIDVPSVCSRACVFCGISRVPREARRPRGDDHAVERAIDAATAPVLFTGDDAMSHPSIERWIARAAAKGPVSLIGPPRAGRERALAERLAQAGLARWSSGLFGGHAGAHDAVAGESGAFDALRDACEALRAADVHVEFVTLLARPVLAELASILEVGAAWSGTPVVVQLYVPDPSVGTELDAIVAPWSAIRDALAGVEASLASVEGAPPCVLPGALRRGPARLDRSETTGTSYPALACGACELRGGCPGVAASSLRAVGEEGLGA